MVLTSVSQTWWSNEGVVADVARFSQETIMDDPCKSMNYFSFTDRWNIIPLCWELLFDGCWGNTNSSHFKTENQDMDRIGGSLFLSQTLSWTPSAISVVVWHDDHNCSWWFCYYSVVCLSCCCFCSLCQIFDIVFVLSRGSSRAIYINDWVKWAQASLNELARSWVGCEVESEVGFLFLLHNPTSLSISWPCCDLAQ